MDTTGWQHLWQSSARNSWATSFSLRLRPPRCSSGLLLAIICAETAPAVDTPSSRPPPLWVMRSLVVIGLLILGWALWRANVRPMLADAQSWRGYTGRCTRAILNRLWQRMARRFNISHTARSIGSRLHKHWRGTGDFVQAEKAMLKAIALRPTDPVLLTQLAAIYEAAGNQLTGKTQCSLSRL